jgi:hypothetical protein
MRASLKAELFLAANLKQDAERRRELLHEAQEPIFRTRFVAETLGRRRMRRLVRKSALQS